jgi:uncharacterized protein (DUF1786 family)
MRILTVDIGTGTQDIYLYDARLDLENGFKLVAPSPTMMVHRRLRQATRHGRPVLLSGVTMGGGPSQWAVEAHIEAGYPVYATPDAARSFNDDLAVIRDMGVLVIGEDEVKGLPASVERLELRDFDFPAIARAFGQFGVELDDLAAVVVSVFDHGAAPPDYSDRQFRFDYIAQRLADHGRLSGFAFPAADVPPIMTRLAAVVASAADVDAPLVVMDTAPAAVLGATLDERLRSLERLEVVNVGNFHTLAFRLGGGQIEGVFEHHTGLLDQAKLDGLLLALAAGTLEHEQVFADHGHGAAIVSPEPLDLAQGDFGVVVTGPRRAMLANSTLRPYFATPFGDMMLAGCFGMLAAAAEVLPTMGLPDLAGPIRNSLKGAGGQGTPPWEL